MAQRCNANMPGIDSGPDKMESGPVGQPERTRAPEQRLNPFVPMAYQQAHPELITGKLGQRCGWTYFKLMRARPWIVPGQLSRSELVYLAQFCDNPDNETMIMDYAHGAGFSWLARRYGLSQHGIRARMQRALEKAARKNRWQIGENIASCLTL